MRLVIERKRVPGYFCVKGDELNGLRRMPATHCSKDQEDEME